ncbi:MAG: hypothetical protein JJT90_09540 [Ectothiorhodospiraceae bacterium]|nr:hypothetical protein [Ectothiorhodospiraceae bacterium]
MNRKTVIISSILGALLAMGSAQAEMSHADRTLHNELVGIGAIGPDVGPSTVVRTEPVPFASDAERRAAEMGFLSQDTRVVGRYDFAPNPARDQVGPDHARLVGIGVATPIGSFHMVPAADEPTAGLAASQ